MPACCDCKSDCRTSGDNSCREPTGNLDSRMGEEIMDILLELNELGVTVVMVTHDEHIASKTGRIVRLLDGKLV